MMQRLALRMPFGRPVGSPLGKCLNDLCVVLALARPAGELDLERRAEVLGER